MNASDFNWLVEHGPELFTQYRGKWIAVRDGKVVGVGDTASEAAEQAHQDDPEESFILEAVDHDADVIYAGL